jgi:hypothetical protein
MSYDALMRWEWEGGAPAPVGKREEAAPAEPAENTVARPQPMNGRQRVRGVATAWSLPSEARRGDGSER